LSAVNPDAALIVQLRDEVASALEDTYACTRVWEAWQYNTMTQNDFIPASEDDNVIQNVLNAFAPVLARLARAEDCIKQVRLATDPGLGHYYGAWSRIDTALVDYHTAKEASHGTE
jgi:hypothetical protein